MIHKKDCVSPRYNRLPELHRLRAQRPVTRPEPLIAATLSTAAPCWVISDGAAGNERQATALAAALGVDYRVWRLRLPAPWRWFAPRLLPAATRALPDELRQALRRPPALAIGCGRQAAWLTHWLHRHARRATFCVQILDPRIDSLQFDRVIAPRHDGLHGGNVLQTLGALNPVDDAWLALAANRFASLADLPAPRTAVLIGASNHAQVLDAAYFDGLCAELDALYRRDGGSFLVSTSRRTPAALAAMLRQRFAAWPGRFWGGAADGENPYAGFLAYAQRIVVTPDSVNMLSEACASGVPVFTWLQQPLRGKLVQFHAALRAAGHLQTLQSGLPPGSAPPAALRETAAVAAQVRQAWRQAQGANVDHYFS